VWRAARGVASAFFFFFLRADGETTSSTRSKNIKMT